MIPCCTDTYRREGVPAVPARPPGGDVPGRDGPERLLPDPDVGAGGGVHEPGVPGVRAAVAGARLLRARLPDQEQGAAAQVRGVRQGRTRWCAGALLRRQPPLPPQIPQQVLLIDRVMLLVLCCDVCQFAQPE
jgi:hypothetical protein